VKNVLLTGATGFVGRRMLTRLLAEGFTVTAAVRRADIRLPAEVRTVVVQDMACDTDWSAALAGQDAVLHCAARVHMLHDPAQDPLAAFRAVNRDGTLQLARQAAETGVRRFVFVSSIGVNGAQTQGAPFSADGPVAPHSPYAQSKHEAELGLRALAADTGMEVVIVRPPLVYGPGAPGNFATLLRWLQRGLPLPLGAIDNRRSYVALDNLVDLLLTCVRHPAAANQTFLVSDGEDLSTTELLRRMGLALHRPARLLPVPAAWLGWGAALLRRPQQLRQLCASLQVDIGKTQQLLGWRPVVSVDEGLEYAVKGYA
jgi:UDP-glucose 4-epimerase